MKIGIDARWIFETISGVGKYTASLIEYLARVDKDNEYLLFFDRPDLRDRLILKAGLENRPNFQTKLISYGLFSLANQLFMPRVLNSEGIDVFHSTNFMIPLFGFKGKMVVTVHDLIPLLFPHYTPRARKTRFFALYKLIMKLAARRADCIIAVSENSKNDLKRALNLFDEKVAVVYNGIDLKYKPAGGYNPPISPFCKGGEEGDLKEVREKYAISPAAKLILWVGRPEPYKNLGALIKAFSRISEGVNCCLVIAGEEDERYPETTELVKELGLDHVRNFALQKTKKDTSNGARKMVVFTGYLEEEALIDLYRTASLFVLPSFYEGFGLPVLEAFACGVPVIASDRASLPEVAGDAAILIDPEDVDALVREMKNVLGSEDLRSELIAKGLRRAKEFSWEKTARETLKVYEEVKR